MSEMQKVIASFFCGIILVTILVLIFPLKQKEVRIVVADKTVVIDNFPHPTVDVDEFMNIAEARNMRIAEFLKVLDASQIEYEKWGDDRDGYRWYHVYTDGGEYKVGADRRKRIFSIWK